MIAHLSSVFGSKWLGDSPPPPPLLVPGRSNEINWWPGGGPGGLGAIGHFPAVFRWERIYFPVPPLLPQHILAVNRCTSKRKVFENKINYILSHYIKCCTWVRLKKDSYKCDIYLKYQIPYKLPACWPDLSRDPPTIKYQFLGHRSPSPSLRLAVKTPFNRKLLSMSLFPKNKIIQIISTFSITRTGGR